MLETRPNHPVNLAPPAFFSSPAGFRDWLEKNSGVATELNVGFYKVGSGLPSMTWPESVDEALCFGWIDGIRKRIDDHAYQIRFTPRKRGFHLEYSQHQAGGSPHR